VKGIRAGTEKQEPIKFEDMPTWEDAKLMAGHTKNLRDRTIIKVLWESGARIGELLTLKVGSVEDVDHGLYINIKESKTILRPVFLRLSEPDLLEWLSVHPLGNDKEAPLFCKMEDGDYTKALSQRYIYDLIMRLKQLCNITKKVNPHRLRHGSASYFSDFLSDSDMDSKFGWAIGSNIKKRYTHKNRKAVENKILKLAGIGEGIGSVNIYEENGKKQIKCFTCKELNDPERKVCHKCRRLLDISKAEQEQKLNKQIERFIDSDQELKEKIIDHLSKKEEAGK
jgi:integrase/recombinase XerD